MMVGLSQHAADGPSDEVEAFEVSRDVLDCFLMEGDCSWSEGAVCLAIVDDENLYFRHFFFDVFLAEALIYIEDVFVNVSDEGLKMVAFGVLAEISKQQFFFKRIVGPGWLEFGYIAAEEEQVVNGKNVGLSEMRVGSFPAIVERY
jgi:hypothetical protein